MRIFCFGSEQMLSLTEIVRANTKQMLRQQFMQMVMSSNPTANYVHPFCDFEGIFNTVLTNFGVRPEFFHLDQFDYIIWEESDNDNNDYSSLIRQIMHCYRDNRAMYMGFWSFIVNRNHELAREIFKTRKFAVASCLPNLDSVHCRGL